MAGKDHETPVENLAEHVPTMEEFHKRYMVSNKACRHWSKMIWQMDIDMIVPQYGRPFKGEKIYFNNKYVQTTGAILAPFLWDVVREKGELS